MNIFAGTHIVNLHCLMCTELSVILSRGGHVVVHNDLKPYLRRLVDDQ